MGFFSGISRILLFILNVACLAIGLAMLIIGILYGVSFTQITDRLDELSSVFHLAPTLLMVVGGAIMLISFFGCCGALRRNSCMLTTYGVILIIIIMLQIALVVYAFLQYGDSLKWQEELTIALEKLFGDSSEAASQAVDFIQETFECCGVHIPPVNPPASCCGGISPCSQPYSSGCSSLLSDFINSSARTIGIVAVSLGAIEVIAAILAIWTAKSKRGYSEKSYE